ncbi:MAG: 30S ribosomal protein S11 [Candidatus Levybacteria bacterium RIFCSPLOWO2_01_FULL_39_24]|nr:MAG: 30S ribosomal protein S11 [Candidatus Levybacteria bacterium RIFCSPHIGHO2_01_FULL_40_16]OGH28644.1 MAG: 30S ribosomal protein S11 [Candidatus Levybacteria bacterium RIFCSPHIGHO2_12_FULL_39_9]OGH46038.1 MAG: 30S ribosomal protein S11 [Candidatus Levybacteria bacterium RIFCSPLOWO2_01_FULL_39_24]
MKKAKKTQVAVSSTGRAYITSTFNNTLITVTNDKGDPIGWSSAGSAGFKGTRKSTPFAATSAMEAVVKKAVEKGLKTVEVYVKGPGAGRDSALRAIKSGGLSISLIADITPVPHNGPRAKKKRRI